MDRKVAGAFDLRGLSYYLPTRKTLQRSPHVRTIDVVAPLFGGLLFVPDWQAAAGGIRGVDGVIGYLRMGECYPALTAGQIEDIRECERLAHVPLSERKRQWRVGQGVRITNGPLSGFLGRIERFDSATKIRLIINEFARWSSISIDAGSIEAI
jgi:transcription antitermination factor NusG